MYFHTHISYAAMTMERRMTKDEPRTTLKAGIQIKSPHTLLKD